MSLEAALEEERLEIIKLLERPAGGRSSLSNQHGSYSTPSSPRPNYSTPLLPPLHNRSRASSPHPKGTPIISLIDAPTDSTVPSSHRNSISQPPRPGSNGTNHRGSVSSLNGAPKLLRDRDKPGSQGLTPNDAFNFHPLPSVPPPASKRASQGPVRAEPAAPSSHRNSFGASRRSLSPMSNAALHQFQRSASPRSSSGRLASPPPVVSRKQITTDQGVPIDLDHAYAKLSDDALARSGGVLGRLPERRPVTSFEGEHIRAGTGESLTREGGVRLQKDYDVDEHAVIDSSDDETSSAESIESGSPASEEEENGRGRPPARRSGLRGSSKSSTASNASTKDGSKGGGLIQSMIKIVGDPGGGGGSKKKKGGAGIDARKGTFSMRRTSMSMLAAAEEERKAVSSKYKVQSLLAPSISITPSGGAPGSISPTTSRRTGVHPCTNFDVPSHNSTPMSSDTEADVRDYRRAQKMEINVSPIGSTLETHRVVRTIVRGEYEEIVREAEDSNRRTRKYLVATDLSAEAQHALEWTIGTVLRDGDTLMAIYAIDQDTVENGAKIVSDDGIASELTSQAAAVGTSLSASSILPHTPGTSSPLSNLAAPESADRSRERTKAERERYEGVEAITRLVEKLLKKTRLQVRVTIEVIHCKSPKHLLTEIIDLVEPTLVVLGSRGRSALKGVLLGSFSNYLVTKSSVPVMVARKKLKHTKKFAKTNVRQPNNLTSSATNRQLAFAVVD